MLLARGHGHVPSPLSFIQSLSQGMAQLSQILLYFVMVVGLTGSTCVLEEKKNLYLLIEKTSVPMSVAGQPSKN